MEWKWGGTVAFWLCRDLIAAPLAGKLSQIMESTLDLNVSPSATSTRLGTAPGMATPALPWAACASA